MGIFSDLTVNYRLRDRMFMRPLSRTLGVGKIEIYSRT